MGILIAAAEVAAAKKVRVSSNAETAKWCRGFVALDQIRTVDEGRLVQRLGEIASGSLVEVLHGLQEMFAE